MSAKRTIQSPLSVSAMPTGSPFSVSLMKTRSPPHLMEPSVRTRRMACQASYQGSSTGRPQRGPVERRRRLLAKRLVGTVVVEVLAEAVEADLLMVARTRGRRFGRLGRSDACARAVRSAGAGPARCAPTRCRPIQPTDRRDSPPAPANGAPLSADGQRQAVARRAARPPHGPCRSGAGR